MRRHGAQRDAEQAFEDEAHGTRVDEQLDLRFAPQLAHEQRRDCERDPQRRRDAGQAVERAVQLPLARDERCAAGDEPESNDEADGD
jgi:hypothetical protein